MKFLITSLRHYGLYLYTFLIIKKKQWINALSFKKAKSYTPFIILCEARTGSTLLHTYLNSHEQLQSYGEILRRSPLKELPDLEVLVFKPHTKLIKAVGLKIFYNYQDDAKYAKAFQEILQNKDIKIIHLIRKDVLKLFVSLKIAERSNVWSEQKQAVSDGNKKIEIKVKEYGEFREAYIQKQQALDSLFGNHQVLTINYEELTGQTREILDLTQKFLGVKPQKLFSLLRKQNPESIESLISNYDEIQKFQKDFN